MVWPMGTDDALFRAVFAGSMDAIVLVDDDARFVDANPAACVLFGRERDQLLMLRVGDVAVENFSPETWRAFLQAGSRVANSVIERPRGERRFIEVHATASILPGRHLAMIRDATDRAIADEDRQRFRALFEGSNEAIVGWNRDFEITMFSRGAERVYGFARDEVLGRSYFRFIAIEHHGVARERGARILAGESFQNVQAFHCRKDGAIIELSSTITPIRDPFGAVVGGWSINRDVTAERAVQERVATGARLAALGRLAAGLAHEITNPLQAVIANVALVERDLRRRRDENDDALSPDAELLEMLGDARTAGDRVRDIVQDRRIFSRSSTNESKPRLAAVDLNAVILSAQRMLRSQLKRARVVNVFGDIPHVDGVATRLAQVLVNLLMNACQALPEGGASDEVIRIRTMRDGDRVIVEVMDTGAGITPDHLPRVFEPFFTTKPEGVGVGLGLPISKRIIEELGGELSVSSVVGEGTTFRIVLPVGELLPEPAPIHLDS